jgi:hypothetical protein
MATARQSVTMATALLFGAASAWAAKGDRMDEVLGKDAVTQCVGRFCFTVPASMTRSGDAYKVQGVELEEIAWDPAAKDGWERAWQARVAAIEALKQRRETPSEATGEIVEQRVIEAGRLRAVRYVPAEIRSVQAWGALLNAGSGGLWLKIDFSERNEPAAMARIREIASAYRVRAPGEPAPAGAFHLARGVVAAPFKLDEEASARFKGHPLALELAVKTGTRVEPAGPRENTGLLSRLLARGQFAVGNLSGFFGDDKVRAALGARTVSGIRGDQMILRPAKAGDPDVRYGWRAVGDVSSGAKPDIEIEMTARSSGAEKDKTAIWDAILESFRPAP